MSAVSYYYNETKQTTWMEIIQSQPTDVTFLPLRRKFVLSVFFDQNREEKVFGHVLEN